MASNTRWMAFVAASFVSSLLIVGSSSRPLLSENGANLGDRPAVAGNVDAATSGSENVVPAANGNQMFPSNMPPPPPGALNDSPFPNPPMNGGSVPLPADLSPPTGNREDAAIPGNPPQQPAGGGQMFPQNMPPPPPGAVNDGAPPPASLTGSMAVPNNIPPRPPVNSNQMFPPDMPPPPPGAVNDPGIAQKFVAPEPDRSAIQTPSRVNDELKNTDEQGLFPKIPSGSMFPQNMPPPPPGTFNEPPAGPVSRPSQFAPAAPPADAAVEPVYLTGQQVPYQATPAAGGQHQLVDPANVAPTQDQAVPVDVNPGQTDTAIEGMYAGDSAALAPNVQNGLDAAVQNTEEGPNSPADGQQLADGGSQESSYDSGAWETGSSYSDDEDSVSIESWMNFLNSDSSYEEDSAPQDESEEYWSDESSEYSNLDWLLESSDSDWETEESSEWDSEQLAEAIEQEEEFEEALEQEEEYEEEYEEALEKNKEKKPKVKIGQRNQAEPEGTRLILYCIPVIILVVLVMMAWRNYRGKIRVVTAPIGQESRHYDWKPASKSDEQMQPMLDESQDPDNGY